MTIDGNGRTGVKSITWRGTHENEHGFRRGFACGCSPRSLYGRHRPTPGRQRPSPSDLFLASIGIYAEIYGLCVCQQRSLLLPGLRLLERIDRIRTPGMVEAIRLEIQVPRPCPEKDPIPWPIPPSRAR